MSKPTFINSTVVYHDNSKEYNIDARGADISSVIRACQDPACSEKEQATAAQYENILPIPKKGKYTEVRRYIEERCKFDEEFRLFVEQHSRVELCMRLTDEFGWDVDEHALGVNMNRNR